MPIVSDAPAAAPAPAVDGTGGDPAADTSVVTSFEPAGPGVLAGPTPDLRLADDVPPKGDAPGETVDAELAAALDRLRSDRGASSSLTPASRFTTRETVFRLTPARAATSFMVALERTPPAPSIGLDNVVITKREYRTNGP